jgi:hypothetical protein
VNKTIYIRDEDVPVWDRAKELAGDKLSPIIVEGLKRFIGQKEVEMSEAKGFERIELSYRDADDHGIPKKKAFYGKWIISPQNPIDASPEQDVYHYFAVARTAKDAIVMYSWHSYEEGESPRKFDVFPSLTDAAALPFYNYPALQAIEKLGVPVEELDI